MTRTPSTTAAAFALAGLALLAGCGGSSDAGSGATGDETTSTAPDETEPDATEPDGSTTSTEDDADAACPSATVLTGVDDAGNPIEIDAVVSTADVLDLSPPHTATFSFANYEIDTETLRGVFTPTPADGEVFFSISVQATAELEPATFVDQTADPAATDKVTFTSLYTADGRQFPGNHTVEITEVTDTEVCGTITPDDTSASYVEGSFTAERIDA